MQCTSEGELQDIVASNYDLLCECGWTKPSVLVKEKDKVDIIQTMSLHHVILRSKAEIDQFCDGLQACGVLGAVRQHPDLGRPFFTIEGQGHLTTGE